MDTPLVKIGEEQAQQLDDKWRTLLLLAVAELLAMGLWFSASVAIPVLTAAWRLDDAGKAWLTISVQIGFVVGSLISALLNLSDRIPSSHQGGELTSWPSISLLPGELSVHSARA